MSAVHDAWMMTATQGQGLFCGPTSARAPDCQLIDAVPSADKVGPWADLCSKDDSHGISGIVSHHIWLLFWLETWQVRFTSVTFDTNRVIHRSLWAEFGHVGTRKVGDSN